MQSYFSCLILCCLVVAGYGNELVVTHKPSYVTLEDNPSSIKVSEIQHVLSAVHGFTLHKELSFGGLYASSPFTNPKASAVLTLYGDDQVTKQLQGSRLNLKTDDVYVPVQSLKHHLSQVFHDDSNVVEIGHESKVSDFDGILEELSDNPKQILSTLSDIYATKQLNLSDPESAVLMRQASLILQSLNLVKKSGSGNADLYTFELYVPSVKDSALQEEITGLVKALVEEVNKMMTDMYGDDYVVLVLSLPESNIVQSRKTRSLLATDDAVPSAEAINLAEAWSEDYPVIFHIILWLVVFMALLIIFVTHGMMTMDPGSDSIIYRMTTTRIKKD